MIDRFQRSGSIDPTLTELGAQAPHLSRVNYFIQLLWSVVMFLIPFSGLTHAWDDRKEGHDRSIPEQRIDRPYPHGVGAQLMLALQMLKAHEKNEVK